MLPFDDQQVKAIWPSVRDEFNRSDRLLDVVVACFFDSELKGMRYQGVTEPVLVLVMALLAKACRTHRAVAHAAVNGLGEDAMTLARSLYETTMSVLFILQKPMKQKQRAAMYHAWAGHQKMKMLRKWKSTPGLKRQSTKKLLSDAQRIVDYWSNKAPGVDVQRHWSGTGSLESATRLLREDRSYQTIYRFLSSYGHGADVPGTIEVAGDGRYIVGLVPSAEKTNEALHTSSAILWMLADRINKQWGFGLDQRLSALRPTWQPPKTRS